MAAFVAIGVQTWRVVDAIFDAQRIAVVPLPTRENEVALGGVKGAAQPTSSPAPSPTAQPAIVSTGIGGEQPVGSPTRLVDPPAPPPTQTQRSSATVALSPTAGDADEDGDDPLSRLDVVRQVVEASMANGDPGASAVWEGKTDLYIMVLGVDRRDEGGDQNADVILIAHLDLIEKRLAAVSLPRDLLVEVPGFGPDKINGSYNLGVQSDPDDPVAGAAKVRDTIESVFGVPIDNYVLLDFEGFEKVIDAVDGVEVDVPEPIRDEEYPTDDFGTEVLEFAAGPQTMDGDRALKYVRTRHGDSDDGRRARQQQVLLALFAKGKSFTSATRADRIILALGESVQTGFTLEQQLTLARIAYAMDESAIAISSLGPPILVPGQTPDGRWAYVGDISQIVAFVQDALAFDDATAAAG